jgi:hypothetical protein
MNVVLVVAFLIPRSQTFCLLFLTAIFSLMSLLQLTSRMDVTLYSFVAAIGCCF